MDLKQKSFFQTSAGIMTGLAGVLTAIVGLLTVSVQLGWIGSNGKSNSNKTTGSIASATSTSVGGPTTSARTGTSLGSSATTASAPQFSIDPTSVTFDNLGPRDQLVTIRNVGSSSIPLQTPTISGVDASQFKVTDETCGSRLDAGRSCQVKVTFAPTKGGTYTATLVISPANGPAKEVPLKGTSLF